MGNDFKIISSIPLRKRSKRSRITELLYKEHPRLRNQHFYFKKNHSHEELEKMILAPEEETLPLESLLKKAVYPPSKELVFQKDPQPGENDFTLEEKWEDESEEVPEKNSQIKENSPQEIMPPKPESAKNESLGTDKKQALLIESPQASAISVKEELPLTPEKQPELKKKEANQEAAPAKIPDSRHTALFLNDQDDDSSQKEDYSLSKEFAKAKKHKSFAFYAVVLGFISALGFGTYLISEDIQKKSRQMQFQIADFEDLNLADMINKAKEAEKELLRLKQELEDSKNRMQSEISRIKQEAAQKIQIVLTQKLSEKEKQRLIKQIKAEEAEAIWNLRMLHEAKIREKEEAISSARSKLGDYEKKLKNDFSREKEAVLADKDRVHGIELEKIRKFYEQKISDLNEQSQKDLDNLKKYHEQLIAEIRKNYNDRIKLLEDENIKTKEELKQKQALFDQESARMATQINELQKTVDDQGKLLEKYQYALDNFTRSRRETGYVLDPRNKDRIIVIINGNYRIQKGDKGIILDDENRKVADVEFFPEKDYIWASVTGNKNVVIEPFYRILIQLR